MPSEPTLSPKQLPGDQHEVIAVLESVHVPWEDVDSSPKTHEVLLYKNTNASEDDVAARIKDASIVICSICRLSAQTLEQAPYLRCIITHAVGTDHIDLAYCRQAGIQVMNCTDCSSESVAEHAIALYFATRRGLVAVHNSLAGAGPSEWKAKGSLGALMRDGQGAPPRTCAQETAAVVGYGAVGRRIAGLCRGLGMEVVVSERKQGGGGAEPSSPATGGRQPEEEGGEATVGEPARIPFTHLLRRATVIFLALPLCPQTANLISAPELALARPDAVVVNVSRGGIVDETAVVEALRSRQIFGYGTDVFAREPAAGPEDSVLLGDAAKGLNLTLTAHLAWFSAKTILNQVQKVKQNLRAYWDGDEESGSFVVHRHPRP